MENFYVRQIVKIIELKNKIKDFFKNNFKLNINVIFRKKVTY